MPAVFLLRRLRWNKKKGYRLLVCERGSSRCNSYKAGVRKVMLGSMTVSATVLGFIYGNANGKWVPETVKALIPHNRRCQFGVIFLLRVVS